MAGDGHHCHRGLDDRVAEEVQAELGLLVVPLEQRSLDYLGSRRRRYALIVLQFALAALNIRGAVKNQAGS